MGNSQKPVDEYCACGKAFDEYYGCALDYCLKHDVRDSAASKLGELEAKNEFTFQT